MPTDTFACPLTRLHVRLHTYMPTDTLSRPLTRREPISEAIFDFDSILRNMHLQREKSFFAQNPLCGSKSDIFLNLGGLVKAIS